MIFTYKLIWKQVYLLCYHVLHYTTDADATSCGVGPNGRAKCAVESRSDGKYNVNYVPTEIGEHTISVRWNGREIQGQIFSLILYKLYNSLLKVFVVLVVIGLVGHCCKPQPSVIIILVIIIISSYSHVIAFQQHFIIVIELDLSRAASLAHLSMKPAAAAHHQS